MIRENAPKIRSAAALLRTFDPLDDQTAVPDYGSAGAQKVPPVACSELPKCSNRTLQQVNSVTREEEKLCL